MAFCERAYDGQTLNAGLFQWIRTSIAKKPYFCDQTGTQNSQSAQPVWYNQSICCSQEETMGYKLYITAKTLI